MPDLQKIGPYEVVSHECRHDLSDVYTAYDPQENRKVSIRAWNVSKLEIALDPAPPESATEIKSAFLYQARAAGRLHHDNIARTYDSGEDPAQGLLYAVYEWFNYSDITIYTKRDALLPPKNVLAMTYKLALALDYAHRNDVMHFHVCPLTIFLDNDTRTVKLVGFEEAPVSERVRARMIMGAPFPAASLDFVRGDLMYMAPELVTDEPVDSRADLFSLGLVFLSLLVGGPVSADRLDELLDDIPEGLASGDQKRRFLRRKRLPDASAIIRRALGRYAADRYQTGAEMAQDISDLVKSLPENSPQKR